MYHLPINHKDYNFREAQEIKKYFPFRFCGIFSGIHCSHRHSEPLPQYGSFISRISPEYLHTTESIFILWNWTKLWKLDSPTFFYNIYKIFPYYGIGQNYGHWIFQPFLQYLLSFPCFSFFFPLFVLQYFQIFPDYGRGPFLPVSSEVITSRGQLFGEKSPRPPRVRQDFWLQNGGNLRLFRWVSIRNRKLGASRENDKFERI